VEEISTKTLKTFTTEPKFRRFLKRGAFISLNRALEFMKHLWDLRLKDVSYDTLEFEFINYFGSNDKRTVERYLGRVERIDVSTGLSKVVRMNRQSGKIAQFEYLNERRLPAKKGLLEILGYITRYKEGKETRFRINHEAMPYYTVQTTLKEHEPQEAANNLQELERESSEASKEDLRVCSIPQSPSLLEVEGVRGKGNGENPILAKAVRGESVSPMGFSPNKEEGGESREGGKEKKEEAIDSTHTNQSRVKVNANFPSTHGKPELKCSLTEEEIAILTAKPLDSEPDRAHVEWKIKPKPLIHKPKKCVECGKLDVSNPYRVLCPLGYGMRSQTDTCVLEGI